MPFADPQPLYMGFTLQTRTSLTFPGPWGVLEMSWEPAAYASSLRQERDEVDAGGGSKCRT
jgi:hypothetical protein